MLAFGIIQVEGILACLRSSTLFQNSLGSGTFSLGMFNIYESYLRMKGRSNHVWQVHSVTDS